MPIKNRWHLEFVSLTSSISITGLAGLEPTTYGLGNRRSIRLSYSPITGHYSILAPGGPSLGRSSKLNPKAGEVIAIGDRTAFGLAGHPVEESPGSPMARPAG